MVVEGVRSFDGEGIPGERSETGPALSLSRSCARVETGTEESRTAQETEEEAEEC